MDIQDRYAEKQRGEIKKALKFEKALHRWPVWLDSIAKGRKELKFRKSHPQFEEMISIAKKALAEMNFTTCFLLEVYWLCCVFADYETAAGFKFDKLILPEWFPSNYPHEEIDGWTFDFVGKRIYPPVIWNEVDRKFWFERDEIIRIYLSVRPEKRAETYDNYPYYPDRYAILMLPADHPVRKFIKMGRPITIKADGETLLE